MRKTKALAAVVLAGLGTFAIPMEANATVKVSPHVQTLQHRLHVLNKYGLKALTGSSRIPVCVYEDGSSQWYCHSGPQEGVKYTARVVKVYNNGDVLRRYHYRADGHDEYVREGF